MKRGKGKILKCLYWLLGLGVLLCAGLLIVVRVYGLPSQVNARILQELNSRGFRVTAGHLFITPFGEVGASDVKVVYVSSEGIEHTIETQDLRLDFRWISWWRGESFLESARFHEARVVVPLDKETQAVVDEIDLKVVFEPESVKIRSAEARCLGMRLRLKGALDLRGYKPPSTKREVNHEKQAKLWKDLERMAKDLQGKEPLTIDIEVNGALSAPESLDAKLRISGQKMTFKGVKVQKLDILAALGNQMMRIDGQIQGARGHVNLEGSWRLKETRAKLNYFSNVDLSVLFSAIPEEMGVILRRVQFQILPENEGTLELSWDDGMKFLLRSRSIWRNFSIEDSRVDYLYFPFSFDGKRLLISDALLRNKTGECKFSFLLDGNQTIRARLNSDLDPTSIKHLVGEGVRPFLDSLHFSQGPEIEFEATGKSLSVKDVDITGNLHAKHFSYKGVELEDLKTPFHFANFELHAPKLYVKRKEGLATGEIRHNFKTKIVKFTKVKTHMKAEQTAVMFGDKLVEYTAPYRFFEAPLLEWNGILDLGAQEKTNLSVMVKSKKGMKYDFLGRTLTLSNIEAELDFKGKRLAVTTVKPLGLFDGTLTGVMNILMEEKRPKFTVKANAEDQDFGKLMNTFFGNGDVSGRFSGGFDLKGVLGDLKSLDGKGDITIVDGVLYPIPIFGSFSEVLNSLIPIPDVGYSKASRAKSAYEIHDGFWKTDKIEIYSDVFALIGKGSYNFVDDDVKLDMRVNVRGLPGIALFALSKLFEYEGTGSIRDTQWSPKLM